MTNRDYPAPPPPSGSDTRESGADETSEPVALATESLRHTGDLKNVDAVSVAAWLKQEIAASVEEHSDFMMGMHFQDTVADAICFLAHQLGKPIPDMLVHRHKVIAEDNLADADKDEYKGTLTVMGEPILHYSYYGNGEGMAVDSWDDAALNRAVPKLLEFVEQGE